MNSNIFLEKKFTPNTTFVDYLFISARLSIHGGAITSYALINFFLLVALFNSVFIIAIPLIWAEIMLFEEWNRIRSQTIAFTKTHIVYRYVRVYFYEYITRIPIQDVVSYSFSISHAPRQSKTLVFLVAKFKDTPELFTKHYEGIDLNYWNDSVIKSLQEEIATALPNISSDAINHEMIGS